MHDTTTIYTRHPLPHFHACLTRFRQPENRNHMIQLTELVRILEQRGHIFPTDPQAVTDSLRQTEAAPADKLMRRAQIIDRDRRLVDRIHRHRRHLNLLLAAAALFWLIFGFLATYGLMRQSSLNFFLILAGVLGINTLMLLIWLAAVLMGKPIKTPTAPLFWARENDAVGQALLTLYGERANRPAAIWQRYAISHRLASAGLAGMFAAALLLLLVRQYSFNWESTLLGNEAFAAAVATLAWLPDLLGFSVPDAAAVATGRNSSDTANAAQWGSLLLGSILCYGLLPRLAAWLFCIIKMRRHSDELDINLPYYQNILQKWQRRIVDSADDYRADTVPPPAAVTLTTEHNTEHWAVLLDSPYPDNAWFEHLLGQEWLDLGVAAGRDEVAELVEKLQNRNVQMLVGVRAQQSPDRGSIRQLTRLSQAAQGGLLIQLLNDGDAQSEQSRERLLQWQNVLNEHGWAWLQPPPLQQ